MVINRYVIAALIAFFLVLASYFIKFYVLLGYDFSIKPEEWGQLGDYVGGMLNPIFGFISVVLLIKSLTLQNEANENLRDELKENKKTEKLRSFENLFFNMINSQKELFNSFEIEFISNGKSFKKNGVDAVIEIENRIEIIRSYSKNDGAVRRFLEYVDSTDKVFSVVRAFYIMAKMTSEKLSDNEGFSIQDRRAHFLALINFTDFSQLRLVIIGLQFMSYHSVTYLRGDNEFVSVLKEVGLSFDSY